MANNEDVSNLSPTQQSHSASRRGADNGLRLGVYFVVFYASMIASGRWPLFNTVTLVLAVGVPFYAYRLIKTDYMQVKGMQSFAAVWLDGMVTFLGGALLSSGLLFVYLRWVDPGFLTGQWELMVSNFTASGDPSLMNFAEECQRAEENGFAVTPILFTMTMLWTAAFTGTLLSLLIALVVSRRRPLNID